MFFFFENLKFVVLASSDSPPHSPALPLSHSPTRSPAMNANLPRDSSGAFVGSGLVISTHALDVALKGDGFVTQRTRNKAACKAAGQKNFAFVSNVAAMRAAGKTDAWITQKENEALNFFYKHATDAASLRKKSRAAQLNSVFKRLENSKRVKAAIEARAAARDEDDALLAAAGI